MCYVLGVVFLTHTHTHHGHRFVDYQPIEPTEYASLVRDVNQFVAPTNATDPRFRTLVQQEIYQSVITHTSVSLLNIT